MNLLLRAQPVAVSVAAAQAAQWQPAQLQPAQWQPSKMAVAVAAAGKIGVMIWKIYKDRNGACHVVVIPIL